jgi:hypothetical protein
MVLLIYFHNSSVVFIFVPSRNRLSCEIQRSVLRYLHLIHSAALHLLQPHLNLLKRYVKQLRVAQFFVSLLHYLIADLLQRIVHLFFITNYYFVEFVLDNGEQFLEFLVAVVGVKQVEKLMDEKEAGARVGCGVALALLLQQLGEVGYFALGGFRELVLFVFF